MGALNKRAADADSTRVSDTFVPETLCLWAGAAIFIIVLALSFVLLVAGAVQLAIPAAALGHSPVRDRIAGQKAGFLCPVLRALQQVVCHPAPVLYGTVLQRGCINFFALKKVFMLDYLAMTAVSAGCVRCVCVGCGGCGTLGAGGCAMASHENGAPPRLGWLVRQTGIRLASGFPVVFTDNIT